MKFRLVIYLILLVLTGLVYGGVPRVFDPLPATLITVVVLFGLPGFLATALILDPREFFLLERLTVAFVLGIMLLLVPATLLLVWHATLQTMVWISLAITVTLALGYTIHFWSVVSARPSDRVGLPSVIFKWGYLKREGVWLGSVFVLLLALILYLFATAPILRGAWDDRWTYLAYVQKYVSLSVLDPGGTLYNFADIRMARTGWLVVLALISRVAGVQPVEMYGYYLSPILAIVSIFCFYTFARTLFNHRNLALFATLIQIVYLASSMTLDLGGGMPGIGLTAFMRICEDKYFAMLVLLPITLTFMLRYLQQGKYKYLGLFILALISLTVTHPISFVLAGLSLGSLALVHILTSVGGSAWGSEEPDKLNSHFIPRGNPIQNDPGRSDHRTVTARLGLMLAVLVAVAIIPLEARSLVQAASQAFTLEELPADDYAIQLLRGGQRHILFWNADRYMAAPTLIARPMIILALVLTPLLIRWLRHDRAAQFLFSNMVIPLAIIYNPWTAPLLGKVISAVQIRRVGFMLPVALIIGYVLYRGLEWLRNRFSQNSNPGLATPILNFAPVAMVVLLITVFQAPINQSIRYVQDQHKHYAISTDTQEMLKHLDSLTTPSKTILLADQTVNNLVPAFASELQPLTFRNWSIDEEVEAKIERFYQASLLDNYIIDLLKQYHIQYIILESQSPLATQLKQLPHIFSLRYQNDTYVVVEVTPNPAPNQLTTANTYSKQWEWDKAIVGYQQALTLDPDNFLAHFGLARTYYVKNDFAQAIAQYEQALALEPGNVWGYLHSAEAYLALGRRLEQANSPPEEGLKTSLPLTGNPIRTEINSAAGAYQKAADLSGQAFRLDPDNQATRRGLLNAHLELGDQYIQPALLAAVIKAYKADIDHDPDALERYQALAQAYQLLGQPQKSVDLYRRAVEHCPTWAEAYYELGRTYENQGDLAAAVKSYETTIELKPTLILPYLQLANLYQTQNKLDQAKALYRAAARQNPTLAWPHLEAGQLFLRQMTAP